VSLILALDLGTNTGVARGRAGAPPSEIDCSTWQMPSGGGRNVGAFAAKFMTSFKAAMDGVDIVIFEQPFIGGSGKARPDVVRRFYGMAFAIEGVCSLRGVACVEANIASLKKEFAGLAKAQKEDMILASRRRGFKSTNEHEADACACWLSVVQQVAPRTLHLYDPQFRGMFKQ